MVKKIGKSGIEHEFSSIEYDESREKTRLIEDYSEIIRKTESSSDEIVVMKLYVKVLDADVENKEGVLRIQKPLNENARNLANLYGIKIEYSKNIKSSESY
ncbi:MAG: hypothetical protein QW423_00305 [Candidatus Aenigmatarchaeota archaeon]